jgi:hypothetical protein
VRPALTALAALRAQMHTCTVGFSGVIFGLKAILTYNGRGRGDVAGFSLPMHWLSWGELVLIQLVYPRASWLAHAAGILAGLAHVAPAPQRAAQRAARRARVVVARVRAALRRAMGDDGGGGGMGATARPRYASPSQQQRPMSPPPVAQRGAGAGGTASSLPAASRAAQAQADAAPLPLEEDMRQMRLQRLQATQRRGAAPPAPRFASASPPPQRRAAGGATMSPPPNRPLSPAPAPAPALSPDADELRRLRLQRLEATQRRTTPARKRGAR